MAQVVILGKTRMGDGICLGGLEVQSGRSIRLLPAHGKVHPVDTRYKLGEVWDLELDEAPRSEKTAPHTEDIRVLGGRRMRPANPRKLRDYIVDRIGAPFVKPHELFDRRVNFTLNRRAYISPETGIPLYSTGFWRMEKSLSLEVSESHGKRSYRYAVADGSLNVKFVGVQEPLESIPPETVLRFSLSHWFQVPQTATAGFWLQLSGWFL